MGLLSLFRKKIKGSYTEITERSQKENDNLTDQESAYLARTGRCPDCGGALALGPSGGCAMNVLCRTCDSEYNLGAFINTKDGPRIFCGQRNGKADEDRKRFFSPHDSVHDVLKLKV